MKKVFLFLIAAITLVACGDNTTSSTDVESITLTPSSLEIAEGSSKVLTLTVTPTTASDFTQDWTSSDESVATVSSIGTLTAVSEGNATITVSVDDGAFTATCEVTVKSQLDMLVFNEAVLFYVNESFAVSEEYDYQYDNTRIDSGKQVTMYILPDDVYIDGDGYMAGVENYIIEMQTTFTYNSLYWFSLATYGIEESMFDENGDYIPYAMQMAEFDPAIYTNMFQDMVDDAYTSADAYPFYRDLDTRFYMLDFYDSETTYLNNAGYISASGGYFELSYHTYETSSTFYGTPSYSFEGTFFGNQFAYGFKTEGVGEEEDWVYPLEMADMTTKTFTYGSASAPAATINMVEKVDRVSGELQVQVNRLTKQALAIRIVDAKYKIK
ncbi:MAG: Ig-like domain-containing protein [bacterium]